MNRWLCKLLVTSVLGLTGCTGNAVHTESGNPQSCPAGQVVTCTGGRVAQGARISDREPRICECRPQ